MAAQYVCEEKAPYLAGRNEVYRARQESLQVREANAQAQLRNLPEANKQNTQPGK